MCFTSQLETIRCFTSTKGYGALRVPKETRSVLHEPQFGSGEFGSGEFGSGEFESGDLGSGDIGSGDFGLN